MKNMINSVVSLRHVGIVVSDLSRSLTFYRDLLGFSIVREMDESGLFLDNILKEKNVRVKTIKLAPSKGGCQVELLQFISPESSHISRTIFSGGISHFSLTVQDLNNLYFNLLKNGVECTTSPQISEDKNVKVTFCIDPDGNYIELVEMMPSEIGESSRKISVGIMQGRLSLPEGNRIQSFPQKTWANEFILASQAKLDCIEWIYETGTDIYNPLRTNEGIEEIKKAIQTTGVKVRSICADYYMNKRLIGQSGLPEKETLEHFFWLIKQAGKLKIQYIVLPFVDSSSLKSDAEISGLRNALMQILVHAEKEKIEIHLETDLPHQKLHSIYSEFSHPFLKANYDIGNSAALGYDPKEELTCLSSWLGSVHVKDRKKGGGTVPLGTGNADFPTCFGLIRKTGFSGPFILQVAREPELSELELAKRNKLFVEQLVEKAASDTEK
ncbi:MAG: TIM barrel protein [Candidatus Riflebacteria bacterium]|nr:TIM barrel protein [Candidatus Riflebacteria bacterium]